MAVIDPATATPKPKLPDEMSQPLPVDPNAPKPAPALAAGWEVGPGGGNMVKNTATGQVVDTNHPIYQAALGPAGVKTSAPETGGELPAPAGGAPTTAGGALTAPAPAGATTAQGTPTTAAGAFQQALVNRLTAPPPDANSAAIKPAIAANKLAEQRGMERGRAQLAERAAQTGTTGSGGFETALTGLNQDRAQREGQFAGNAVMGQAQQQAQELTQALALTGGMLGDQDRLAMSQKLAELNAQIQREQLAQQGQLGNSDIALRQQLGQGSLNLGMLSALMQNDQFGRQLGQQGTQFGQSLGLQAGLGAAGLNQQAVLQALGYL